MDAARELTTISISRTNHKRLIELGAKNESFDSILSRVLNNAAFQEKQQK